MTNATNAPTNADAVSGYTACPCCGYDTISSDVTAPELCSDCEDHGCDVSGESPADACGLDECETACASASE